MTTYAIHLDTVQNFSDYIYMLEHFSFRGMIRAGKCYMEPGDLISLFECALGDTFLLQINCGNRDELDALEEYMRQTGLLLEYRCIA